jgi:hypothetical protein
LKPSPSDEELLKIASQQEIDRSTFIEELLFLRLFTTGASLRTARDRGSIKASVFPTLFSAYLSALKASIGKLAEACVTARLSDAELVAEQLDRRSSQYAEALASFAGNPDAGVRAVSQLFCQLCVGQPANEYLISVGASTFAISGNKIIDRLSKMRLS